MWPNLSLSGLASMDAFVVAPTRVNFGTFRRIVLADGPLPTTRSMAKSSIAEYRISSTGRRRRCISSMNRI